MIPASQTFASVMVSTLDDHQMGDALGFSDFLTRPIDRHQLLAILDKYRTPVVGTILVSVDGIPGKRAFDRTELPLWFQRYIRRTVPAERTP
jgi:hypothetical protein